MSNPVGMLAFSVEYANAAEREWQSRDRLMHALQTMRPFYEQEEWNEFLLEIAAAMAKLLGDKSFTCEDCGKDFWIEEVEGATYDQLMLGGPVYVCGEQDDYFAFCRTCAKPWEEMYE